MLQKREWLLFVALPFLAVLAVDQLTKFYALSSLQVIRSYGPISLGLLENRGFFLGSMADFPQELTVMLPATVGGFVVYILVLAQYFLPIRSLWMRVGMSILAAGVVGNVLDRVRLGYVVDFIQISIGSTRTGVFNVADALQWFGVAAFISAYVYYGRILYRTDERRKRKFIDPEFQIRYCAQLIGIGLCFAILSGFISTGYLRVLATETQGLHGDVIDRLMISYLSLYTLSSLIFFVTLAVVGIHLSHRIIGPIRGFESFLNDLLQGKFRTLKLRDRDEFNRFEQTSEKFLDLFMNVLKINPQTLQAGEMVSPFSATTYEGQVLGPESIAGKPAWIIIYRYATCPLCADHLATILPLIRRAQDQGVFVAAVYGCHANQFISPLTGQTKSLLESAPIPLIADPERLLYRKFRAQISLARVFHPHAFFRLFKALGRGFKQSSIDGDLGQLPAHVILEPNGKVRSIYYGSHIADHPSTNWITKALRIG